MDKVAVIGQFTCREGKNAETEEVLARMVAAAADEPGAEIYSYFRGEADTYWFFALMADAASLQGHGRSAAMQEAMAAFGPLVAAPPQMHTVSPVAAAGMDL
jgi:quinol monooxygenase YgiN